MENIVSEIKKLRNLNELKKETETLVQNSKHQLDIYKKKGVEEKLKQQTLFDADVSKIVQIESGVSSYVNELNSIVANHEYLFQQEISGSEFNKEVFDEIRQLVIELKMEFEILKNVQIVSV